MFVNTEGPKKFAGLFTGIDAREGFMAPKGVWKKTINTDEVMKETKKSVDDNLDEAFVKKQKEMKKLVNLAQATTDKRSDVIQQMGGGEAAKKAKARAPKRFPPVSGKTTKLEDPGSVSKKRSVGKVGSSPAAAVVKKPRKKKADKNSRW